MAVFPPLFLRLLSVAACFAALFLSSTALDSAAAEAAPLPYTYCVGLNCYESLEEAEAALKSSGAPHYRLLEPAGNNFLPDGTVQIMYDIPAQPASFLAEPQYYTGVLLTSEYDTCVRVESPNPTCADEQELIDNLMAFLKRNDGAGGCYLSSFKVSGAWSEPFETVGAIGSSARNMKGFITHYKGEGKTVTYQYSCPDSTKTYTTWITKQQYFLCEAGFVPLKSLTREQQLKGWEDKSYCFNRDRGSVHVKLSQIKACAANENPCYPATGDKARFEPDFQFAGRSFDRVYHSLRQLPSALLSPGWRHSFEERIFRTGDAQVFFHVDSNGYVEKFKFSSPTATRGASTESSGNFLQREPGGYSELTLLTLSGEIRSFDRNGILRSITNPSAPASDVFLYYSDAAHAAAGRPTGLGDRAGRIVVFEYDSKDRLVRTHLPDDTVIRYSYDVNGNLSTAGANGNSRTYHYETGRDLLAGITDEAGEHHATFDYDDRGRVISSALHSGGGEVERTELSYLSSDEVEVITPAGASLLYSINPSSRAITAISDPAGTEANYYDSSGRRIRSVDRSGVESTFEYQGGHLAVETRGLGTTHDSDQSRVTSNFNQQGRIIRRTILTKAGGDWKGIRSAAWAYDSAGRVAATCEIDLTDSAVADYGCGESASTPAGVRQVRYVYCTSQDVGAGICPLEGLLRSVDGPRTDVADVSVYFYRSSDHPECSASAGGCAYRKGDLWKVTNALGQTTETLRYDGAGRVLSVRDANGVVTDMEYHPRGWLAASKVRGPDGSTETDDLITRIDYEPTGLVKRTTLPDGSYTAFSYDAAHRLTGISDGQGNRIVYTLDNAGNRTKEETVGHDGTVLRTLSRVFNQLGQLKTQRDAYQSATHYTYDANGNVDQVTDALGRMTQQDYDPLNRLTRTVQDVGGIEAATEFRYDALDRLTAVVDPKGLTTGYAYNGLGDLLELSSPDTGTSTYGYDSAGNRTSQTDARGITTTYSYDALNRLTGVQYPTTGLDVTYTYDLTPTACDSSESYSVGRLTGLSDASGSTQYCYDRFGRLVRKVQTTSGQVFVLRYAYTKAGQLSAIQYPDGTVADYVRDGQGRVTEVGVTRPDHLREVLLTDAHHYPFGPVQQWTFGNGRTLLRVLDQNYAPGAIEDGAGGLSLGFEFDAAGNLSTLRDGALSDPPQALFDYDGLNRLTEVKDGPTGTPIDIYAYDATGNRTSVTHATGQTDYTYDATNHRLQAVGSTARQYDAAGNTIAIGSRQFVYNDAGRLAQVNGGQTASYTYNGRGEQVRRSSGADNLTFVYDEAGQWLGAHGTDGTPIQQVIWLDNLPVGVIEAGQLHYIEPDHLGTPRAIIEPQRNVVVWKWDLTGEAFGETPPKEDMDGDGHAFVFDLRFPGQRYDAASGLNYNYFRDYESITGRYVQSDPLGLLAGVSTFSYVSGSPFIWADMYGLLQWNLYPVQWTPTLAPGLQTRTFPGDGLSTVEASTMARTTLDWDISAMCGCGPGGYGLDEYTVSFTPIVLMRQRYDSFRERTSTRRAEMDHVRDFTNWIGSARSGAQALEDAMKGRTFSSVGECTGTAQQAMQQLLQPGARKAAQDSNLRWDESGRHTLIRGR